MQYSYAVTLKRNSPGLEKSRKDDSQSDTVDLQAIIQTSVVSLPQQGTEPLLQGRFA
ncbi:MAG: hypothetical protein ACKVOK_15275 [Flavobacteriales bacterium]